VLLTVFSILKFPSAVQTQLKPCLEKLNQDQDADVKYYSNEALESKFNLNLGQAD
jgi:hypothetical protein